MNPHYPAQTRLEHVSPDISRRPKVRFALQAGCQRSPFRMEFWGHLLMISQCGFGGALGLV
eukprot:1791796-Alexandrium_andersonii.AAC.1